MRRNTLKALVVFRRKADYFNRISSIWTESGEALMGLDFCSTFDHAKVDRRKAELKLCEEVKVNFVEP